MSDWITLILQVLQLGGKIFDLWHEKDDVRVTAKKEALNDAIKGVADSDSRAITLALDRYNAIKQWVR